MKKLNTALLAAGIACAGFISTTYAATCPQPDAIKLTKSDKGYLYSAPGWKNYMPKKEKLEIKNFFSVRYIPDSPNAESGEIGSCTYQLKSENKKLSLLVLSSEEDGKKVFKPTGEGWKSSSPVKSKETLLCRKDTVEQCSFKFVPIQPLDEINPTEIETGEKQLDKKEVSLCPSEASIENATKKFGTPFLPHWTTIEVNEGREKNGKKGFISTTYKTADKANPYTKGYLVNCLYKVNKKTYEFILTKEKIRSHDASSVDTYIPYEVYPVHPENWEAITYFGEKTENSICEKGIEACELKFKLPPL